MGKVTMSALDTFSATSVQAEPLRPGDEFEVASEADAKDFADRGLAKAGHAGETPRKRIVKRGGVR